tara:strand:+ start:5023 stop:5484 length:462 start_codon:yes stop_codon:yes gene_type:complete
MNKDFQHNEGLTISEDGRGDGEYLLDVYNWDKMKHGETFSFVKITNMNYDTDNYIHNHDFHLDVETDGLDIDIRIDDEGLVKEWIGIVLHGSEGVKKELLKSYVERYGGGIESINESISMSSRMDVLDFDFEVLSLEESFKLFPKFIKVIPSN